MSESKLTVAILGCGSMGSAFAKVLGSDYKVHLFNRTPEKAESLAKETNAVAFKELNGALKGADIVILAFKPKDFETSARLIAAGIQNKALVASLLSTVSLTQLQTSFPNAGIVRVMPNIAAEYGQSATALCCADNLNPDQRKQAEQLATHLGHYVWIQEDSMPGFIALAGSGPAFHCVMIEAMVEAGIAVGFKPDVALKLTLQALRSSIAMLEESGDNPEALKWRIATPGGTTIAGLMAAEEYQLRNAVIQTFLAAAKKAQL